MFDRYPCEKGYANVPPDLFANVKEPVLKAPRKHDFYDGKFGCLGYDGETFLEDLELFCSNVYLDRSGECAANIPDLFLAAKVVMFLDEEIEIERESNDSTYPPEWKNKCYSKSNFHLRILWPIEDKLENMQTIFECDWWKYRCDFMCQVQGLIKDAADMDFDWNAKPITEIRECSRRETDMFESDKRVLHRWLDYGTGQFYKYVDDHNAKIRRKPPRIRRPTTLLSQTSNRSPPTTNNNNNNKTKKNWFKTFTFCIKG